ncbi:MAG: glycosyl hydrolase 115 family protein [Marinilabiliaceae bacterium]|nr:glycosyl hydrolase 115 family protein [Marinilabiliaceae bacterium]
MTSRHLLTFVLAMLFVLPVFAIDNPGVVATSKSSLSDTNFFTLVSDGLPCSILVDESDATGLLIATNNLSHDFGRVTGHDAQIINDLGSAKKLIIVGTLESKFVKAMSKSKQIDTSLLKGKVESYIMTVVGNPLSGVDEALVVVGSDMRGSIYGVYELSEQIGVSPWYDWMDVPVERKENLAIKKGLYTAGEPAVRYRGLFLNDEAPCLTSWVKNTYGTNYGDHRFYARVFELILRLRGNYLWPAMWSWSFYADDELNSKTAQEMGVIMGTSHHEPMARNHQEWARHRGEYGAWDYVTNQKVVDDFFRKGIERAKDNEDIITIGMRGDGDAPMGGKEGHDDEYVARDKETIALLERIMANQRKIIKDVTGKPAEKRQQVWALYKEVQRYYDLGLRVPDDVIILLSDDNWGHVRRVPSKEELKHPGGWGMYYHVDYVGAPRNSKWLNVTPIQNMWEQLQLTYAYGIDKLWILNVGDLKPMEYPISLFMDMAWNAPKYLPENGGLSTLERQLNDFCAQQFGEEQAPEAARIFNLLCKYNGRSTAEMLDKGTYDLHSGEWRQVVDEYLKLEAEALRQYLSLEPSYRDAYKQLILFPLQAMCNVYEMYYSQAMNHYYASLSWPEANKWADNVERCFKRDSLLCADYNKNIAGGKWDGMMTQKHIGYFMWNDNFPADKCPKVFRVNGDVSPNYSFSSSQGYVSIEAPHYQESEDATSGAKWTTIDGMGRTLGGVALMPYTLPVDNACLRYSMHIPTNKDSVTVHIVTNSTLPFLGAPGHRLKVGFQGGVPKQVVINERLNENPENIYSIYYPTVARRVLDTTVRIAVPNADPNGLFVVYHPVNLEIAPLDPGIVIEKIVVDWGGYTDTFLFSPESETVRIVNR